MSATGKPRLTYKGVLVALLAHQAGAMQAKNTPDSISSPWQQGGSSGQIMKLHHQEEVYLGTRGSFGRWHIKTTPQQQLFWIAADGDTEWGQGRPKSLHVEEKIPALGTGTEQLEMFCFTGEKAEEHVLRYWHPCSSINSLLEEQISSLLDIPAPCRENFKSRQFRLSVVSRRKTGCKRWETKWEREVSPCSEAFPEVRWVPAPLGVTGSFGFY